MVSLIIVILVLSFKAAIPLDIFMKIYANINFMVKMESYKLQS